LIGAAVLQNGTVMTWGSNQYEALGDGKTYTEQHNSYAPVLVCAVAPTGCTGNLSSVKAISGHPGGASTLALLENGEVRAWGFNNYGTLGNGQDGPAASSDLPVEVCAVGPQDLPCPNGPHLSGITAIASGAYTSFAFGPGGKLFAWGDDAKGELGDGNAGPGHYVNVPEEGPAEITAIAGGSHHTLGLRPSGPQFQQNGVLLGKAMAQSFDAGEVTLENSTIGKARCRLLAAGNLWNEGLRGKANTEAFTVSGCRQTEPAGCPVSVLAEEPPRVEGGSIHRAFPTPPWSGEMFREGTADRLRISGIHVTVIDVCGGAEIAFQGVLRPRIANGVNNGLHPSHLQFGTEAGYLGSPALGETAATGLYFTSSPLKEGSPLTEVKLAGEGMQLISTTE
jgi:hypothetical protein